MKRGSVSAPVGAHFAFVQAMHLLAGIAFLCLGISMSHARDLKEIKASGTLRVAQFSQSMAPFFVRSDIQWTGFDMDFAAEVANRLGVRLEFLRSAETFERVVDLVAEGRADIAISMLSRTVSRAERVLFSKPYVTIQQVKVVNRIQKDEKTIGVVAGTSYIDYAKQRFPNLKQITYLNRLAMMENVRDGVIDSVLDDRPTVYNWLKAHPAASIYVRLEADPRHVDPLAVAVHPDAQRLRDWLNILIDELNRTGFFATLEERYLSEARKLRKP